MNRSPENLNAHVGSPLDRDKNETKKGVGAGDRRGQKKKGKVK
jgi:hypothetical protein